MISKVSTPKAATIRFAMAGPMPRICPEARYFSIPSAPVGGVVLSTSALNCSPCVRSLIQSPLAVIHSPAETAGVCPTTVTRSRLPRACTFRTAKPFSALWKVTRSTEPASVSGTGL